MKSLMSLWNVLVNDLANRCCTTADRDIITVTARVKDEGYSFLTITLPSFEKDLLKSLDQGWVGSDQFSGFHRSGGLPAFLQGFLCRIFDSVSGVLLPEPCIDSIFAVRQLTGVFGKLGLECTKQRTDEAMQGYVQCESDVASADRRWGDYTPFQSLRTSFAMLFGDSIDRLNRDLRESRYDRFVPKHGPGATADRLVGNQKFNQSVWHSRLEEVFPVGEFIIPNWRHYLSLERIDIREPGKEQPVRVISVPKTLKAPRIIAIEPTCMQYTQQAILAALRASMEEDKFLHGWITLDDQTPNQRMALEGSFGGKLATIDLSEASDRVSNQLVRFLLAPWPDFNQAVDACRSRSADVPDHGVIRLAKFASMGSALTFPIETMVFLAICFDRLRASNTHLRAPDLKRLGARVLRAYGDDLIVPTSIVRDVISDLETLGLKVNANKTFYKGSFRESCGKDYYAGADVSIVRCRSVFPTSHRDANEVAAMVSFRNQLYYAGCWTTCQWLDKKITKILGVFPLLATTSPGLGRHSHLPLSVYPGTVRGPYQRLEVKALILRAPVPVNGISGLSALMKCLVTDYLNPDEKHLERSGRPKSLSTKLRWVPVA